jgi:hypothetical protein
MAKPKIFIASSGRTLELAKQLRAQLNQDYCAPDLWTEVGQANVGKSILAMLMEATREYEFAIVILAKDDVMATNLGDTRKARDNCVFEAGLFMGVIGADRCILLSSVEESDLPSDLRGVIYQPFTEKDLDLTNPEACRRAIVTPATRIETVIRKVEDKENRPLSQERLMERQRSTHNGGELLMDQVVVASVQPLDFSYHTARQVRENIDNYNISYVYFFHGNKDGAEKTCQLLQMVLLSKFLESQSDGQSWPGRLEKVKCNIEEIKQDLERICKNEMIKIFFLPAAPALEYCIHNAGNDKSARLYLMRKGEFVLWVSGKDAYDFWDEVRQARGAINALPPNAVFYGAPGFDLNEGVFSNTLRRSVQNYFPGMGEDVMKLCTEGPTID